MRASLLLPLCFLFLIVNAALPGPDEYARKLFYSQLDAIKYACRNADNIAMLNDLIRDTKHRTFTRDPGIVSRAQETLGQMRVDVGLGFVGPGHYSVSANITFPGYPEEWYSIELRRTGKTMTNYTMYEVEWRGPPYAFFRKPRFFTWYNAYDYIFQTPVPRG